MGASAKESLGEVAGEVVVRVTVGTVCSVASYTCWSSSRSIFPLGGVEESKFWAAEPVSESILFIVDDVWLLLLWLFVVVVYGDDVVVVVVVVICEERLFVRE